MNIDTITHADCLAALANIPDKSVEVVLTDPPYPNGMGLYAEEIVDGIAGLYLASKKATKQVVFFASPFNVPSPPPGWYEVARHIWHKPDARARTTYELVIVWSREYKLQRCKVMTVPLLDLQSLKDWKPHPTQKPVRLVRYLLEQYSQEGDTVLDPFVGSGTTALACQQLKRHFIAIEKNPLYVDIAAKRLEEHAAYLQRRLTSFVPKTTVVEQTQADEPLNSTPVAKVKAATPRQDRRPS